MKSLVINTIILAVVLLPDISAAGRRRRCFVCHSRGERGDCKDPFLFTNETMHSNAHGVEVTECASGWCGKQTGSSQEQDDFDLPTSRMCMRKPPEDSEERCAEVKWGFRKKFMCFCYGDLCNSSNAIIPSRHFVLLVAMTVGICGYYGS